MFQEFYSHSTLLHLPLVALGLFVAAFVFAVWHTLHRKDGDDIAQLPLLHDDVSEEAICTPEGGHHV
jgi:hypothetical protein